MKLLDPLFSKLSVKIPLANILWIILILTILIFTVISAALIYHWRKYGMGRRKFLFVETLYIGVAVLIIAMGVIAIVFV